jgi:hypothetical protein
MTTMTMRWVMTLVLVLATTGPAQAAVIEGQVFDDAVRLGGAQLKLNGLGLRAVSILKGYAAGLYLTQPARTPEQAVAAPGPKRLQMRMLVDVPTEEFVKAVDKGIRRNTSADEQPRLATRVAQFNAAVHAVGKVRKGDVINLDYLPGEGMSLMVNGLRRGSPIAGEDFYAAVLRIFLGRRPVDEELKAGLLGWQTR